MENMSNSELLYDVIDTLNDEEFKDLLDTLSIEDKAEEVIETKTAENTPAEPTVEERLNVKREALQKRLADLKQKKAEAEGPTAQQKEIQEKLATLKKRENIATKLEAARKRKQIQEKMEAARKAAQNESSVSNKTDKIAESVTDEAAQLRAKVKEKLEISRRKKQIQERVKQIRAIK